MSRRKHSQVVYDESGQPVESSPVETVSRRPKNARTWAIHGLKTDGSGLEVIAEGLTHGMAVKMIQQSLPLLRKLYASVRTVKTVVGEQVDL